MRLSSTLGLVLSLAFGLWHFVIPYQFDWFGDVPDAPRAVVVSVDWVNFFFSLLLTGLSALLLRFRRRLFRDPVARAFYGLLVLTWASRVVVTIVRPWAYDAMFAAQLAVFAAVFALLAIPLWAARRGPEPPPAADDRPAADARKPW
ncbi:MAG: hypothetical protein R3A79_18680 [Nannocystaceae bacterium]